MNKIECIAFDGSNKGKIDTKVDENVDIQIEDDHNNDQVYKNDSDSTSSD